MRIAVFVSGGGTNLQNIIDAVEDGTLTDVEIAMVMADRDCYAIVRALDADIPTYLLDDRTTFCEDAAHNLKGENVDLIVLAGFLSIITPEFVEQWKNKIINIHPALLPKYGGKGMYGDRVHKAVMDAGDREGGVSVHFVTAGVDEGEIILQESYPITKDDTLESIKEKGSKLEKELLIEALRKLKLEIRS